MLPGSNKKQTTSKTGKGVVSKEVKSYANDPFFVKKANDSQKFLEKHGFPEELLRLRDAKYGK